ncbi:hypothetical protein FRX31_004115 [Thalictrum thalictroides]|uniref:Uncharacterized protein n=1 Tax=Thalictrum thalictroides TaxID=46969 RepID=A0A7J6X927_THATH|nr:hypothetical protein FRX31_004115 [Thalictrum thalictroides]
MEEIQHNPSDEFHSFLVSKILRENCIDLSKKRKLLDKQLSLPIPKYKYGERIPGSEHLSPLVEDLELEDILQTWMRKVKSNTVDHDIESTLPHSVIDSNSFVEESDCAMSQYTETKSETEFPDVCIHPAKSKREFPEVCAGDEPSTSSGSCGSNSFNNTLYSLDNRSFKKLRVGKDETLFTDDQDLEFAYHADYACADNKTGETKECMDTDAEDVMLYSNGPSDLFVLSSGRWNINKDAEAGMRKPTIDQEFEEYFSMLML